ncbi:flagellar biosynthesis protein FlgN [Sphingosinicella terrae]|uniref:flagellar biosynthesis protein FlgN n=1 Tax=Sphingosinicella terrae TaxID=2172047 RepID=UPI000E0DE518|nr:flagellar biosynthesis protein FlgN [Sphingosinicella terrae]
MPNELIATIRSLVALMREETEMLRTPGSGDLQEVAEAKARLVGWIESRSAQLEREQPGWREALDPETLETLTEAVAELRDVSSANARMLERQIELSLQMMEAIATEAKRLKGTRSATYGATGQLWHVDLPTPVSTNAKL